MFYYAICDFFAEREECFSRQRNEKENAQDSGEEAGNHKENPDNVSYLFEVVEHTGRGHALLCQFRGIHGLDGIADKNKSNGDGDGDAKACEEAKKDKNAKFCQNEQNKVIAQFLDDGAFGELGMKIV